MGNQIDKHEIKQIKLNFKIIIDSYQNNQWAYKKLSIWSTQDWTRSEQSLEPKPFITKTWTAFTKA